MDLQFDTQQIHSDRAQNPGSVGKLMVALLQSASDFEQDGDAFRRARISPRNGKATAIFSDLPYGSYAVKAFHDENGNGILDTNFIGFPTEGFGFSNDAMGRFGPPSFEQAKFEIASERLSIAIHLK